MGNIALEDFFLKDACQRCGECLAACPEMEGRLDDPGGTVSALIDGRPLPGALKRCSSCMTCSAVCPNHCNPYGLILFRWYRRGLDDGYPVRASLVMPLEPENAWNRVIGRLPPDEKSLVETWADTGRGELSGTALFAGCNLRIFPYLAAPTLLDGMPVFGREDLCCGEVYYRMGALGEVDRIARHVESVFRDLPVTNVVAYCQACYNMLANVLPSRFGASLPQEVTYFGSALAERVLSGSLPVKDKLKGLKVTVQDPCHSKLLDTRFQEEPRQVLEYMGCDVREMKHSRQLALCCGLGHGASRCNPLDMARGIITRLREARATGSEYLVVYCNSCDLLFSVGTQVTPFLIPVHHLNELVCLALGEPLPRKNLSRARSMMFELFFKGVPRVLSTRRFSLE